MDKRTCGGAIISHQLPRVQVDSALPYASRPKASRYRRRADGLLEPQPLQWLVFPWQSRGQGWVATASKRCTRSSTTSSLTYGGLLSISQSVYKKHITTHRECPIRQTRPTAINNTLCMAISHRMVCTAPTGAVSKPKHTLSYHQLALDVHAY